MFLDKTLLLKGVAGAAALGGVGGAGIYYREEIKGVFSSSSNAGAGVQADALPQQAQAEDDYGIPTKCSNASSESPCELTLEELKKIKFEGLGGATADDVENFPSGNEKITLKIDNSSTKKYIFTNNSSNPINIKKGSDKTVTLKAGGDTEFTGENKALKLVETPAPTTDDKGIPTKCTSAGAATPCQLTEEDLKKIKFQIYGESSEDVTVTPSPSAGTITLTIESSTNKYKFNNSSSSDVTLKKGSDASKVVTLKASSETEFTIEGNALREVVKPTTDEKGIPNKCTVAGAATPCELTEGDLKKIKFEGLGGATADEVENFPSAGQKITLKINSSSNNKYTFNNSSSSNVTLKKTVGSSEKTVVLNTGTTEFTVESGALKLVEAPKKNNFGLPESCNHTSSTTTCSLTSSDLKNIKFKALDGGSGDVTLDPSSPEPNPAISLSIATSVSTKIYTFKNSGSKLILKKGEQTNNSVVLEKGETEFKEEADKLVSYVETSLNTLNTKIGNLKLPYSCKFKGSEKDKLIKECDVSVDELKKVEFENKQSGDLNITGQEAGDIKLEIKRLRSSDDEGQYGTIADDDLRFIFKNETSRITITGSGSNSIIIPKKSNTEFQINSANKLNKYRNLLSTPPSWGILCTKNTTSSNYECTPYQDKIINFFNDSSATSVQELKAGDSNKDKKIFTAEENVDDYNLGFKFTVKEAISGTDGSPTLTVNNTYEIKYSKDQKKWGYVKKSPS